MSLIKYNRIKFNQKTLCEDLIKISANSIIACNFYENLLLW